MMAKQVIDFESKRLEKLPPREMSRHLMTLPPKQRMEAIISRPDAEAVVAAMPDQDFYLTIKEIGPEDALPLLGLARVDQINHVFDLEMWKKDRVLPGPAAQWFDRLYRASGRKLLAWLYHADFELLVTLFKKWIRVVHIPEDDTDPVEAVDALPKNTLDDQYYWESRYPQYEELIKNVLSFLFETHYGFYKELMNHILWALDAEVEEEAYRFHRGRLEDRAIPDYYDALEIYKAIRPEEISTEKEALREEGFRDTVPSFALVAVEKELLLWRVLSTVNDPELIGTLQLELASLANKIVVADQLAPEDPEDLHEAANKAAATVNLGLDLLSSGSEALARGLVERAYLEHLFRFGHDKLAQLQKSLRSIVRSGWMAQWPAGLNILDAPWSERIEALLGRTPKLVRLEGSPRPRVVHHFIQRRRDLKTAQQWVRVIEAVGPVFSFLNPDPETVAERLWAEGQIRILEEISLGSLVFTAAARALVEGKREVKPIPVSQWPTYFQACTEKALRGEFDAMLRSAVADEQKRKLAWEYLNAVLRAYEEETEAFRPDQAPDPKLVGFFLFEDA